MGKGGKKKLNDVGLLFPDDGKASTPGDRSTTPAGCAAVAAALRASRHPDAKTWAEKYVLSFTTTDLTIDHQYPVILCRRISLHR